MGLQNSRSRNSFHPGNLGLKAIGIVETGMIAPYWWLNERLDIGKASRLGSHFGRVARLGQRSRVLTAMTNVLGPDGFARAGGNMLWNEYVHAVGRIMAECMCMTTMRSDELRSLITLEGKEYLNEAAASPQETILFIGHIGNIGSILAALVLNGLKITVARNALPLPFMERKIARTFRMHGVNMILLGSPGQSNSPSLQFPEGTLTTFIDDAVNPGHTSWFNFGHAQIRASIGPGLLAVRKHSRVLCVTSTRVEGNHYTVTVHPPLYTEYTGDYHRDAHGVIQLGMTLLGNEVQRSPAEWLNWNYAQIRTTAAEKHDDPRFREIHEKLPDRVFS